MVRIYPFAAVRPEKALASRIASVPYDVVSTEEASIEIEKNPTSSLQVIRSDALLPDVPAHDDRVYSLAQENLSRMLKEDMLRRDAEPSYYLYRVIDGDRTFTGLVCCLSVDDYLDGRIRRHELTRYDKEEDRTRHIDTVDANTGLVFLLYHDPGAIYQHLQALAADLPIAAEVTAGNRTIHQVYPITDGEEKAKIEFLLNDVPCLYIADGHHRAASAVNVGMKRRAKGTAGVESQRFMGV
ncbi:MAG TPA: DUF1015 domain-containing protein, partial [Methanomicrobiales archaeon]|nr:DUF1015 domain-containing protein [Methanomicrobiales archaeon]